jgi:BMFP domain-containing protein YqiC
LIPEPIKEPLPYNPWPIELLKEYEELLKRIKALEDQLGCECHEVEKPNYIKLVEERISQLEERATKNDKGNHES